MPIELAPTDESLSALARHELPSASVAGVRYQMGKMLGAGAMGIAYFGMRVAADGKSPVVVKLLRPEYVLEAGPTAAMIVEKEAVALARLNGRVPPTPFVVRMLDSGTVRVSREGREFDLPWLAIEYVHGGAEGTTLSERVVYSVEHTGHAFGPGRAALAVGAIASGLEAVHDVGVVHRDLTPNNVLCCGFGEDEIFKIADFGLARPVGMSATFGGIVVGTVGYAPPEQAALDDRRIGTWSDVFTFAVDVYFMLTGRAYFPAKTPLDMLRQARSEKRLSITESPLLSPDLAADAAACRGIDAALAQATAPRPEERPASAQLFASTVLPFLKSAARRSATRTGAERRAESIAPSRTPGAVGWHWTLRHHASGDRVVRSVAWDGDGRCLAATSEGLAFWNGTSWQDAFAEGLPDPRGVRFVHRVSAGNWLIGGDASTLATFSSSGVSDVVRGPVATESFSVADGDFSDLAVVVGVRPEHSPVLYTLSSRRWLKPLSFSKAATVSALARVADDRWLITGRKHDGSGFLARFQPLNWDVELLDVPQVRALLACAARIDRQHGLAVGSDGLTVTVTPDSVRAQRLNGAPDLSAAAVDAAGRSWAAGAHAIWVTEAVGLAPWERVWHDEALIAPIISLYADVGVVVAMMADGSIVEGRWLAT
ncbi:MAG: serine/threonine protein kinase [Myxococcales bacterium]|nr:serine/threonine protein kinase [Myxococcales bacterium]MCB9580849.1 serine/threonine protein kinase [Polyangiaceae bacterium]